LDSIAAINPVVASVGENSNLTLGENSNISGSYSFQKKNNIVVPIVASVIGGLFILSLIVATIMWRLRRRKQDGKTKGQI
jgi:hypothetical protein